MNKIYFEKKSNFYPQILIPEKILNSFNNELSKKDICDELNLKYPVYKSIPKPNEPRRFINVEKSKTTFEAENGGCFLILGIPTIIFIVAMIINFFQNNFPLFGFGFIIILIVMLSGLGAKFKTKTYYENEKIDDVLYEKLINEYKEESKKIDTENQTNRVKFENQKEKIELIINENYSKIQNKFNLKKFIPEVSFNKLNVNTNKSKSELYFLSELFKNFKDEIFVDVIPSTTKKSLRPDFLIKCNKTGFHIDIEIDEPYSTESGNPIHHDRTNDYEKNLFFLSINWGIIRFSEKQIIQNTEECINLIKETLNSLENQLNYVDHLVPIEKKWTYEEALILSNQDYRNDYLPHNMQIDFKNNKNRTNLDFDELPF